MPDFLAVCEQAARAGGAELMSWRGRFSVREKGPSDPVTEADLASQEAVRRTIAAVFPDHDLLGEESPHDRIADDQFRWIVDPLDGTQNYVHGLPNFCVSLALERRGEILVACIFDPTLGECFTAETGKGAFRNGQRMQVSQAEELRDALVAVSLPPRVSPNGPEIRNVISLAVASQGIRRFGSSALNLAYVAAGRLDAFFALDTYVWDVAAGLLLVQEAGGAVSNLDGGAVDLRNPRFVASACARLNAQLRTHLSAV